jgi:vitamin B12 transporter
MIARRALVLLALMAGAEPGYAQEAQKLDPVVVTATMVETPRSQIGGAVTVVPEEEIRLYNYDRVEDALRQVPGLEIQRSGTPGRTTSLRIRGAGSQQVQLLVDGLRVKSPTLGQAELSDLLLDGIDRIEVVRGPQSTLYGADAIGGVVNIITKKGQGPVHGSVWVEGGSYRTFRERANVQGAYRGFSFNLSGTRFDSAGQLPNEDTEQTAVAGRLGYDFPWKGELGLSGFYSRLDADLPVSFAPPTILDPDSQNQVETYLFNFVYKQPVRAWWDVRVRFGQWYNNSGFQDVPPPPDDPVTDSQIDTRRLEAELLNSLHIGKWDTLTIGLEHRSELGRNRSTGTFPVRFTREINTFSVFAQNDLRLFDRIFLGGGLRYEDASTVGGELTGRASAAVAIKETGTRLRGAWGTGFRAPTINDLFFPNFGNPSLEPERSESYEFGVDQRLWKDRVRLGFTFFHNEFRNLIQFAFDAATNQFLPFNVGRAQTEGVEFSVEADPVDWLSAYLNYTYTDTEDITNDLPLRRFAPHRWNVGLAVTPLERLSVFAQATVVSSQFESSFAGRNPGHHRIDVGGTLRILGRTGPIQKAELTLRIENVTDEKYDEVLGFRALGLYALAGLRVYLP